MKQEIKNWLVLAAGIHATAVDKGWWPDSVNDRNKGEAIALMHSELSEALESLRAGNPPDDKCPEYDGVTVEFADVIIRIMDFSHAFKYDVAGPLELWTPPSFCEVELKRNVADQIAHAHYFLSLAYEEISENQKYQIGNPSIMTGYYLAGCVKAILLVADREGYKVLQAIDAKSVMNKGRAYKHGGKAF